MKKYLYIILFIVVTITLSLVGHHQYKLSKKLRKYERYNSTDFSNGKPTLRIRILNRPSREFIPMLTFDRILKERYNLIYVKDDSYDLVIDGPHENNPIGNQKAVKFWYTEEAVKPNLKEYDLSIGFDHIDDPKYIRIPYVYVDHFHHKFPQIDINYNRTKVQGKCNAKKPEFACIIVSNATNGDGAILRTRLFHKLSLYKKVLSGGRTLNNVGGPIDFVKTLDWMSQCKFVIAYENKDHDGYITEKVFQAYFSGAIPIYYGNKTVLDDINKEAIIYEGDFKTEDELVDYIQKVDQDDELYCNKWDQNIIDKKEKGYQEVYHKLKKKIFEVLDKKLNVEKD